MIYEVEETNYFSKWLLKLKDIQGKVSIIRRLNRVKLGNFGDFKSLGDDIFELRIKTGPGYRIYFMNKGEKIVFLLLGGDKSTQIKDIKKAKEIAKDYQNE